MLQLGRIQFFRIWYHRDMYIDERKYISSSWLICGLLLGIAGLALGTFFDLKIDQLLYQPDASWAKYLAAFGPVPAFWGIGAAGCLLIDVLRDRSIWWLGWGVGFVMLLAGPVYMIDSLMTEIDMNWLAAWITGLLVSVLPSVLYAVLMRNTSEQDKIQCIIILLIVCVGSMLAVQVLKRIWYRPRFFLLENNPDIPFTRWYQPDRDVINQFAALYAQDHDYFRSFPSGHTQSITCLFLWALIPVYTQKGSVNFTMALSSVVVLVVAISRIFLGVHYLSDVSMAFLITFTLFAICVWGFGLSWRGIQKKFGDEDEDDYDEYEDEFEEEPVEEPKPSRRRRRKKDYDDEDEDDE